MMLHLAVQRTLQRYKELKDIIAILGMDELSEEDKQTVVTRASKFNASCHNLSLLLKSLPVHQVVMSLPKKPFVDLKAF